MMTIFNHKPLEFEDSRNKNTLQSEYVYAIETSTLYRKSLIMRSLNSKQNARDTQNIPMMSHRYES